MEQPSTSNNVTGIYQPTLPYLLGLGYPATEASKLQYTDPSALCSSFSLELRHRLPLHNLHWKSASRPVRTIATLNLTLIPDQEPLDLQNSGSASTSESSRKERRHQIPGLRQTPYLKIYLLQCNDVDSYRANSRKLLRDWVKDHTPPSQSSTSLNKQENHDAYEWLIIHLLPASIDGAASRPPSIARIESEKKQSSSRWPSRSSSTVIEKIRADFNGTSKNAVDRVAQIEVAGSAEDESRQVQLRSQDDKNGWEDLVAKMKSLILASFDLRVNQYEEDIKEKEMQRSLPGWNFNTFFILKEGLFRGFESVGLTEDALTGYHELAAGLNAIVDGQSRGDTAEQRSPLFSDSTEELIEAFRLAERCNKSARTSWQEKPHVIDLGASLLNTDRKPFRDLILANRISSFDFQNYVFARQVSLLLSLAEVTVQHDHPMTGAIVEGDNDEHSNFGMRLLKPRSEDRENLSILAEVAQRASNFINSAAMTIRNDIKLGISPSHDSQNGNNDLSHIVHKEIVENIVASWVFSACKCILEATSARSLSHQLDPLLRQLESSTQSTNADNETRVRPLSGTVHREGLPSRTSSLKTQGPVLLQTSIQESFPLVTFLDAVKLLPPATPHSGTGELAAQQGDLHALARRALCALGLQHLNLQGGLADVCQACMFEEGKMQEVKLEGTTEPIGKPLESLQVNSQAPTTIGVCNRALSSALQSKYEFYHAFEELTISTLATYVVGGRNKAAEAMTMDLAVTRFLLKDYEVAASYFRQLAPFYVKDDWSDLELLTLDLYVQCLHRLERNADYVRIGLKTLAKRVQGNAALRQLSPIESAKLAEIRPASGSAASSLTSILRTSQLLQEQISLSMDGYFDCIGMGMYVRHSKDDDAFEFPLVFRSLLPESFLADSIQVQILSVEEGQRSELWLHANGQRIEPGMCKIWLRSNTMFPAWYVLNQVMILCGNVLFVHSLSPPSDSSPFAKARYSGVSELSNRRRFLLWPHPRSLEARVSHSENTHLDRSKSVVVKISSGQNNITQGRLSLRAASAGLRLHTAQAEVRDDKLTITDKSKPGIISFGRLHSNTTVEINVPYNLESDFKGIIVRPEVTYVTERGEFVYACASKISTSLPITINVRDVFKKNALFSTFTVGIANSVPVRILKYTVEGNEDYSVASQNIDRGGHDIFIHQPLSLVSKIHRKSRGERDWDPKEAMQKKLLLHVEYRCLDQDILLLAETICSNTIAATPLQKFSRLVVPAFLSTLHSRFSSQQLETAGLLREIEVGTFEEYSWSSSIIDGLPPDIGEELSRWIRSWHENHPTISLEKIDQTVPTQHLTIPFDIPHVHVLHTVRMHHLHDHAGPSLQHDSLSIGSVLSLQVIVNHTRDWWDSNARSRYDGNSLDFKYEVQALPDDWIVGGQKKGHFSAKTGESSSFTILLLPQRTGYLMLPSIDIRPLPSPRNSEHAEDLGDLPESSISYETDYQHQSETIHVISNLSSTTVGIDLSSTTGTTWLVESKSR